MIAQNRWGIVLLTGVFLMGCSQPLPGGPRAKTYPVTGIVQVDGQPTAGVEVKFHPQGNSSALKYALPILTKEGGKFSAMSYVQDDGLPDGNYKMTFVLDDADKSNPRRELEDRFKYAYIDPSASTFDVTVKGAKVDLGVIELSVKGPAK